MGWRIKSQTETSVALEVRQPFNFIVFAVLLFFFFGIPAVIYLLFWFLTSGVDLFVVYRDQQVVESGDTWYVEKQESERETAILRQRKIKEQGFWPVMRPSIVATALMIAGSVALILFLFRWLERWAPDWASSRPCPMGFCGVFAGPRRRGLTVEVDDAHLRACRGRLAATAR